MAATSDTVDDEDAQTEEKDDDYPPVGIDHVTVVPTNFDPETGEVVDE